MEKELPVCIFFFIRDFIIYRITKNVHLLSPHEKSALSNIVERRVSVAV